MWKFELPRDKALMNAFLYFRNPSLLYVRLWAIFCKVINFVVYLSIEKLHCGSCNFGVADGFFSLCEAAQFHPKCNFLHFEGNPSSDFAL